MSKASYQIAILFVLLLSYTSFSQSLSFSKQNGYAQFSYTSQEHEKEINLYNYRARIYNPKLGKFLATDIAKEQHGSYSYVNENPILNVDPTGECIICKNCNQFIQTCSQQGKSHTMMYKKECKGCQMDKNTQEPIITSKKNELSETIKSLKTVNNTDGFLNFKKRFSHIKYEPECPIAPQEISSQITYNLMHGVPSEETLPAGMTANVYLWTVNKKRMIVKEITLERLFNAKQEVIDFNKLQTYMKKNEKAYLIEKNILAMPYMGTRDFSNPITYDKVISLVNNFGIFQTDLHQNNFVIKPGTKEHVPIDAATIIFYNDPDFEVIVRKTIKRMFNRFTFFNSNGKLEY